jgi:type III secretory pathway component EscS
MDLFDGSLVHQGIRVLWIALVPMFLIPVVGFVMALVQGMMGAREESLLYAVRAIAAVAVVFVFGVAVSESVRDLLLLVLR